MEIVGEDQKIKVITKRAVVTYVELKEEEDVNDYYKETWLDEDIRANFDKLKSVLQNKGLVETCDKREEDLIIEHQTEMKQLIDKYETKLKGCEVNFYKDQNAQLMDIVMGKNK